MKPRMQNRVIDWLRSPSHVFLAAMGLLLGAGLLALFADTFRALAARWNQDSNYGHGYFVPLVSLYLAWQVCRDQAGRLSEPPRGGIFIGALILLFGGLLNFATILIASLVLEGLSFLLVLIGLTLVLGGRAWLARLWAPIAFLAFMVPLPSPLYSMIAFPLQLFVSQLSTLTLEVLSIPVMRDGNLIHLPGQTMHVAEACSGLRQLMAFLAICACAALLMHRPLWYRGALFFSAIPIAILVNVIRVTGTGLLIHHGHMDWTQGWLHTAEGLIMVGLGLVFLMLEISIIDWLLVEEPAPRQMTSPSRTDRQLAGPESYARETAVVQ